jgi:hypothetical protein
MLDLTAAASGGAEVGFIPGGQCGANFGAIINKDYDNYGRTIRDAHLTMQ